MRNPSGKRKRVWYLPEYTGTGYRLMAYYNFSTFINSEKEAMQEVVAQFFFFSGKSK